MFCCKREKQRSNSLDYSTLDGAYKSYIYIKCSSAATTYRYVTFISICFLAYAFRRRFLIKSTEVKVT